MYIMCEALWHLQQRLWAQQPESTKKGFFAKLFHIENPVTKGSSVKYDYWYHWTSVILLRRENELCREIESLRAKVAHMQASLDSTREAQRIVLETKESVMRLLLKQNVGILQEVCYYSILWKLMQYSVIRWRLVWRN